MTPGDRVYLAPIGGGEPTVVEYREKISFSKADHFAWVLDKDGALLLVAIERLSALPAKSS